MDTKKVVWRVTTGTALGTALLCGAKSNDRINKRRNLSIYWGYGVFDFAKRGREGANSCHFSSKIVELYICLALFVTCKYTSRVMAESE